MNRTLRQTLTGANTLPIEPSLLPHLRGLLATCLRAIPRRRRIAYGDLVSLLRQLYAQIEDEALRADLADLLALDTGRLRQMIPISSGNTIRRVAYLTLPDLQHPAVFTTRSSPIPPQLAHPSAHWEDSGPIRSSKRYPYRTDVVSGQDNRARVHRLLFSQLCAKIPL